MTALVTIQYTTTENLIVHQALSDVLVRSMVDYQQI